MCSQIHFPQKKFESEGFLSFQGMDAIEQMDPAKFSQYLKDYENTICGRYPIGVLLNVSAIKLFITCLLQSSSE